MGIRKGLPAKLALTDADDTRYNFKNLVTANADGTPRGGLISPVGSSLITGTATMDVSIGAFAAAAVRDGGVILLSSDGAQAVTIGAAPASNQRTDIVYAKQNDASSTVSTPDANNTPVLGVAIGAAGPSGGTPAALPTGAVEVGRIVLSAGNTNTNAAVITQSAQFTAAPGAVVPFRTKALLDAWTTARTGQVAEVFGELATLPTGYLNRKYTWSGTAWKPEPLRILATITNTAGVTLSFPAGLFPVAPAIQATPNSTAGSVVGTPFLSGISTTGAVVRIFAGATSILGTVACTMSAP